MFCTLFSLASLFVKEKLYIGEATVATIAGLILGPHCLGWFEPTKWGNTDEMTLEISRIVLCIQIVAVAVELPRKYMQKHWLSVTILLLPVMTCGWLVVGVFIWLLIPHYTFPSALLVAACVTATDPVLAAAVVGKGKFAERVPGHLRNLLTAESGCNDGMAFPFIYLSLGLIFYGNNAGEIIKEWITLTILWECVFGVVLGVFLGYVLRIAVAFAEKKNLIDRESFLALFVFLAFTSAGFGSMLGVDDLLVSFAAGTAFGWNGDFSSKTEESHVSTVIDLLLNLAFFVYFGAIVPWPDFNNVELGLDVWRLCVLAVVIIFLRRIPAVLALKPFTPDIKSWREALFCGHFGPIGVGAIFAAILARKDLEDHYTDEETPLAILPDKNFPHYQLIASIWPIVCFVVITSIVVHGSSVAVLALGKRLNRMAFTMSFTITNNQDHGPSWMSRLQKLEKTSTSFSLQRIDTSVEDDDTQPMARTNTIETSGVKVRPAGGARRKRHKKKSRLQKSKSRQDHDLDEKAPERQRPQAEILQLGRGTLTKTDTDELKEGSTGTSSEDSQYVDVKLQPGIPEHAMTKIHDKVTQTLNNRDETIVAQIPATAYQEGLQIVIEDEDGEVIDTVSVKEIEGAAGEADGLLRTQSNSEKSIHSMGSLRRTMSQFSILSDGSQTNASEGDSIGRRLSRTISGHVKRTIVKKGTKKKFFAHRVDNLIVIENEDGEIVRQYKVNKHSKAAEAAHANRSRSGSIVNKALAYVGIKKRDAFDDDTKSPSREGSVRANNATAGPSTNQSSSLGLGGGPAAAGTLDAPSIVYEELTNLFDPSDESDESDLPEETEVERRRRLAALGEIADGSRAVSDEED